MTEQPTSSSVSSIFCFLLFIISIFLQLCMDKCRFPFDVDWLPYLGLGLQRCIFSSVGLLACKSESIYSKIIRVWGCLIAFWKWEILFWCPQRSNSLQKTPPLGIEGLSPTTQTSSENLAYQVPQEAWDAGTFTLGVAVSGRWLANFSWG